MLFKGIGRTFSTENDQQYETIGAFWDELAAKYGRVNLQGLGYGWKERSIEYAIGLIDGEIGGADRTVTLPDMGWITVRGQTADLGKMYEKIYQEGRLEYEIERFTLRDHVLPINRSGQVRRHERNVHPGYDRPMRTGLQHLQARWQRPVPVPDAAAQITTSRSSVRQDAASSYVKREGQTGICSVMSARIFPALTSWKRKPGTDRSTRSANLRWRICVPSGRRVWLLFWSASGGCGPVPPAEVLSVSTQACAAAAAGSIPVQ